VTASSNPAWSKDGCLLCALCVVMQRSLRRADPSSRGVVPTVVCHCVWSLIRRPSTALGCCAKDEG
jgi:hypothetical protein